jgi:iron complex outermembrane receptor protein
MRLTPHALLGAACLPLAAVAQTGGTPAPAEAAQLPPVVVTATRTDALAFDVPASIDRIDGAGLREGRAQINISEGLGGVPGLLARDRQNYAQDVQISVRGFGARSTFGVRGVRLYVDGIPATLPDGQGQISNVDLGSVERIEVLRGPFSALYGNSSGGVIQVFTEEGRGAPKLGLSVAAGSDALRRVALRASGASGGFGYLVSASQFTTDGFRDNSETRRNIGNAKFTLRPDRDSTITLVANSVGLPLAQDPLGLTRAQFEANPRGVDPSAIAFDTRKTVNQTQAGLVYERRFGSSHSMQVSVYGGHRGTEQFQAIPVATQNAALHPGGVISLGRDYQGLDLRSTLKTSLAGGPLTLVGGIAYDALDEQRRGYRNFVGTQLGVLGALRRDEANDVSSFDQYLQGTWQFAPRWSLNAGVRHAQVRFRSTDAFIVGTNPDDSGSARYGATLPVMGLMFAPDPALRLYLTAGRGFETPTLNELAYRANGATGLNFALRAARSTSVELGLKARPAGWGELGLAVFRTGTRDEIVTQTNVGGRSTFQNAGSTRRMGAEAAWSLALYDHVNLQLAATWLDATYRDAFGTCTVTPCTTPNQVIPAGNRIPGVSRTAFNAVLGWTPPSGWRGGLELRSLGRVYVNDANSDSAAPFTVASGHVGYALRLGAWDLVAHARIDNLFDRATIGSVIVNEGNGRFFEPAPGRTWLAGMSATLKF